MSPHCSKPSNGSCSTHCKTRSSHDALWICPSVNPLLSPSLTQFFPLFTRQVPTSMHSPLQFLLQETRFLKSAHAHYSLSSGSAWIAPPLKGSLTHFQVSFLHGIYNYPTSCYIFIVNFLTKVSLLRTRTWSVLPTAASPVTKKRCQALFIGWPSTH